MTASFNLITKPWIPCVTLSGKPLELSLSELFRKAHEMRGIEDENPLIVASIYLLLLAIIHRALNGPKGNKEWKNIWKRKAFDQRIENYLGDKKQLEKFDLFSAKYPFFQTPDFKVVAKDNEANYKTTKLLDISAATGDNKTLFSHNLESDRMPIESKVAARLLLSSQQFSLFGLARTYSKYSGGDPVYQQSFMSAPLVGKVLTLFAGDNLFESLVLNLLVYKADRPIGNDNDEPVWEQITDLQGKLHKKQPVKGYLDLLTWKSRHIRLFPDSSGQKVEKIFFTQAYELPKPGEARYVEHPLCWFTGKNEAYKFSPQKAYWRDSSSLLRFSAEPEKQVPPLNIRQLSELIPNEPPRYLMLFGLANDKGNPLLWRQEKLPLPKGILRNRILSQHIADWLNSVEKIHKVLNDVMRNKYARLLLTDGERKADGKEVTRMVKS
jgi:CRISPR system Cascade subunit CasA